MNQKLVIPNLHNKSSLTKLWLLVPKIILLMFVCTATSQAQVSQIHPVDNSGLMCTDTPPLNDGLGWNGECECTTSNEFWKFGESMATFGNTLAISSWDTPAGCTRSGIVSVYRLRSGSGIPEKLTDLQSSSESNLFGNSSSQIAINNKFIAVSGGLSDTAVGVYNRHDLSLHTTLRTPEEGQYNFGRTVKFTDSQMIVGTTAKIYIYNISDWALAQTIDSTGATAMVVSGNYFAVQSGHQYKLFEKDSMGEYQDVLTHQVDWLHNWSFDLQDDTLVILSGKTEYVTSDVTYEQVMVVNGGILETFRRVDPLEWSEVEETEVPSSSHVYPIKILNGQLINHNASGISILDNAGAEGWSVAQFLPFGPDSINHYLQYSDDEIIAVNYYSTEDQQNEFQVSLLSKDSSNQWAFTRSYDNLPGNPYWGIVAGDKLYLHSSGNTVTQVEAQLNSIPDPCQGSSVFCDEITVAQANTTGGSSGGGALQWLDFLLLGLFSFVAPRLTFRY